MQLPVHPAPQRVPEAWAPGKALPEVPGQPGVPPGARAADEACSSPESPVTAGRRGGEASAGVCSARINDNWIEMMRVPPVAISSRCKSAAKGHKLTATSSQDQYGILRRARRRERTHSPRASVTRLLETILMNALGFRARVSGGWEQRREGLRGQGGPRRGSEAEC